MAIKKQITQPYQHAINISKSGLVAIFISARCKSKKQIKLSTDEDLRVEINGSMFREIPPEKNIQLFNIPAAFNGSKLKGLKKTVVFLTVLDKGEHAINLIPRNSAFIEEIKVQELAGAQEVELAIEDKAEDGDRRPWYTFVLVDLPLKSLTAEVTIKWRLRDSDDVKLIIDGAIQKPQGYFSKWKNWLWSGSIFKKFFQRETQSKTIKPDLTSEDLHYIEFYADRMPILHKIKLDVGEIEIPQPPTQDEKAKVVWGFTRLRQEPKIEDNILIDDIKKGEEVVVLERAIKGDRPEVNDKGDLGDSDHWHKVIYKHQEGYIYSLALEIEGEDEETIKSFIIEKSEELDEDANLMLAITEQESKFFPYNVSQSEKEYKKGRGVMQITDETREEMKTNREINYDLKDPFDFKQNIEGGIIYFKFIRAKFNEDVPDYLDKLLVGWNAGPYYIKKEDKEKPLSQIFIPPETEIFIKNVNKFYERNKKDKSDGFIKIFLIIGLAIILFIGFKQFYLTSNANNKTQRILGESYQINVSDSDDRIYQLEDNLVLNGGIETLTFRYYYLQDDGRHTEVKLNNQILDLRGAFLDAYAKDIDKDNIKEIIIELAVGANGILTKIYTYQEGRLQIVPVREEGALDGFISGGIKFVDYDDDGDLEVESVWRVNDICKAKSGIYEYIDGEFVLTKYITRYEPTCRDAMKKFRG